MSDAIIEMCDLGHRFAKLPDHPRDGRGLSRCPHCMAQGLDRMRSPEGLAEAVMVHAVWSGAAGDATAGDLTKAMTTLFGAAVVESLRNQLKVNDEAPHR